MSEHVEHTDAMSQTIPAPHAGEQQGKVIRWEIDRDHSDITFSIKHMIISTVRGRFRDFHGYIDFNPERPNEASIEATIMVASIDTGSEQRDEHLCSAEFFDAARYPTITFESKSVEPIDKNHFKVVGELTMHGVTREVELDTCFDGMGEDPFGKTRAAFTANAKIDREMFGLIWNAPLGTGGVLVGKDVEISLHIQAVKKD